MLAMATKAKPPARPRRSSPPVDTLPSLRFFHSEALREQSLEVINAIEASDDPLAHREALADVVAALTHSGLDYFFMQPLAQAQAGFVAQRSATIGVATMEKVMGSVGRSIIGHMDEKQLRSVCAALRSMMG